MYAASKIDEKSILLGADAEISHFAIAGERRAFTGPTDLLLLSKLPGVPAHAYATCGHGAPLDVGRRYDPRNGACYYSELGHLEVCAPLCAGPRELVAYTEANRERVREALRACNESFADGSRIVAMFECRCGRDENAVSIGTHVNYLVSRDTWIRICSGQYPAATGFVASAVAGIQLIAGQGCVGAANRRPAVEFQISQRSDFITRVSCLDTMGYRGRGLINTRDEPECGTSGPSRKQYARFHHICLDFPVSEYALFATTGVMSLLLAAVSEGVTAPHLILADPVDAFWRWSHDPSLSISAALADGSEITSSDYLARLIDFLARVHECRNLTKYLPDADNVLEVAAQLSEAFVQRNWLYLGRCIDWVSKRSILAQAIADDPTLDWRSPHIAMLDQFYGSADPSDSFYLAQRDSGAMDRLIDVDTVNRALNNPPESTRSWGHAMLLRRITVDQNYDPVHLNWDAISMRHRNGAKHTVRFSNPRLHTRKDCEHAFANGNMDEVLSALTAVNEATREATHAAGSVDRGVPYAVVAERREG